MTPVGALRLVGFRPVPPGSESGPVLYECHGFDRTCRKVEHPNIHCDRDTAGPVRTAGPDRRVPRRQQVNDRVCVFFTPVVLRFVLVDPQRLFDVANGRVMAGTTRFETLVAILEDSASCEGLQNACLVNLGIPANPAYFGEVSRMRGCNGWKQVNLLHDCLPLTNPNISISSPQSGFDPSFANPPPARTTSSPPPAQREGV